MIRLLALLPPALVYLIFSRPELRDVHGFSLLPYSSIWFFLWFSVAVAVMFAAKRFFSGLVSYSKMIFVLNVIFFLFLFPQPLHAFLFAGYFYFYYVLRIWKPKALTQVELLIFTLLPMLVARSTREIQFIGLSYITFRAFHIIMDAQYFEKISPTRYFSFLMFFPAILAGPIDRWQNFGAQLKEGYANLTSESAIVGYRLVLLGAVMKYVLAELVQQLLPAGGLPKPWLYFSEFYGYATYLYLDFAGYSAMAIGCGMMIGLTMPQNFNRPYLSRNPQDFWRRFHITLGAWLTDYFFKPIYKLLHSWPLLATHPLLKQNVSIFMTFFLMGCWNGMKVHYLISGALFGLYSVIFNSYIFMRRQQGLKVAPSENGWSRAAAIFVTLHACCLALYFFGGRTELFK